MPMRAAWRRFWQASWTRMTKSTIWRPRCSFPRARPCVLPATWQFNTSFSTTLNHDSQTLISTFHADKNHLLPHIHWQFYTYLVPSLPSQLVLHIKNHWRSQIDSDYFPETHYLFLKRFHPALLQPQTHLSKTLVTVVPRTSRLTHTKTSNRYLKHCFLKYATRSYSNQFAIVLHKPSMFFSCVTTHLLITYVHKRSKTNTQTQSFQVRRIKLIRRSKPQRLSFSLRHIHSYTAIFFKTTASEAPVPNTILFLFACFISFFTLFTPRFIVFTSYRNTTSLSSTSHSDRAAFQRSHPFTTQHSAVLRWMLRPLLRHHSDRIH